MVRVIPTGIDIAAIAALRPVDARLAAGWPPDSIVVVSLGRLAPEKSVDLLMRAFAMALADDPALRLLLVGGGPSEASLRERAQLPDLLGRVHLAGSHPRLEALALTKGGDLFAFASQTETQGLVLAEALAGGLPVVAIDAPGVHDSVRDGVDGVVVPALPAADRDRRLAAAIAALAGDAQRRGAMAAAALRHPGPHRGGGRPLSPAPRRARLTLHGLACAAADAAYNACHASESDGPLRFPSID